MKRFGFAVVGLALFAAISCTNDLPRASDIAHMRVLGATTEVEGDIARSSPKPGESADLTWSMAYPDINQDDSQLESLLFTCTAPASFSGVPTCQELIDAALSGSTLGILSMLSGATPPDCNKNPDSTLVRGAFSVTCVSGTPRSTVTIEPSFSAGAKLIEGVICRNGTPKFDLKSSTGVSCTPKPGAAMGDTESISVYGTIPVEYDADSENHNPSIDAASFVFGSGDTPWLPSSADAPISDWVEDCSAAARGGQLLSSDGIGEDFAIRYEADARESYQGMPEPLEFAIYVTKGKIDHHFALFSSDAAQPLEAPLHWELSKADRDALADQSELLRFYFTVLDHRGGFALTTRDLCVGRDLTHSP